MTPQQRLLYLLETATEPTNTQVTFALIEAAVGFAGANLVAGTIQAATAQMPLLATVMTAMSTPAGLSFSSPQRQAIIDALAAAGNWPESLKDAVKGLGYRTRARWQIEGYATEPTIKTTMVEITIDAMSAKLNNASASLGPEYVDSLTVAELEARIAAVLASTNGLVA